MSAEAFTHDVFLSHSSKDKAVVRAVAEQLRKDGLRRVPQPSTLNPQPTGAPLTKERRFIPLRLDKP